MLIFLAIYLVPPPSDEFIQSCVSPVLHTKNVDPEPTSEKFRVRILPRKNADPDPKSLVCLMTSLEKYKFSVLRHLFKCALLQKKVGLHRFCRISGIRPDIRSGRISGIRLNS